MLYIVTGGTIDKMPSFLKDGKTFNNDSRIFSKSHIPVMLTEAKLQGKYSVKELFMIDSLDMTNEHRKIISEELEKTDEAKIVITHGTDNMPETARYLKANPRLKSKTIVLTGSMIPYSVKKAEAMFNIGSATTFSQLLPSGVYVVMNGRAFEADNVRKDTKLGIFLPIK